MNTCEDAVFIRSSVVTIIDWPCIDDINELLLISVPSIYSLWYMLEMKAIIFCIVSVMDIPVSISFIHSGYSEVVVSTETRDAFANAVLPFFAPVHNFYINLRQKYSEITNAT